MAGLCWMAVMLTVLLSAGNTSAAVDQNQLARLVDEILRRYRPSYQVSDGSGQVKTRYPMFSLAVSIPYNKAKNMYDISQVPDDDEQVRDTILKCDVYTGTRVVAATVLRWPNVVSQCPDECVQWRNVLKQCPTGVKTWADVERQDKGTPCRKAVFYGMADHAEYRTLQRFSTLLSKYNRDDLLLFYVFASPCPRTCTNKENERNILNSTNLIRIWKNYAVVFSDIFQPHNGNIPENVLSESLERLGSHQGPFGSVGLSNIFRCNGQDTVQCTSCSSNDQVTPDCYRRNSALTNQK